MTLRREDFFVVRWWVRGNEEATTKKNKRLVRAKTFTASDYVALMEFMQQKIERLGMHRVWLVRYDRHGRHVASTHPGSRRHGRHRADPAPVDHSCGPTLTATIEAEDFGSFAGIPG